MDLVLFMLGGVECALRREAVRSILPVPQLWRPPGIPAPLLGFADIEGEAVPVVALARLLGAERPATTWAAIFYAHMILIGLAPGERSQAALRR